MVLPAKGSVIEVYDGQMNGWMIGQVVSGKRYRRARYRTEPYFKVNFYRAEMGMMKIYGGNRIRQSNPLVTNRNFAIGDMAEFKIDHVWLRGFVEEGVEGELIIRQQISYANPVVIAVSADIPMRKIRPRP